MRVVVLLLAFLGAMVSFGLGTFLLIDVVFTPAEQRQEYERLLALEHHEVWTNYESQLRQRTRVYPFLLISSVLGLGGGLLAFFRRKWLAAITLLVAGVGPGILHPSAWIFTSLLTLAGLLALFISSKPAPISQERQSPRRHKIDDDDDESED